MGRAAAIDDTGKTERDTAALLAVARAHNREEATGRLDALMATLEGEPRYEFHPAGRGFTGMETTRRFYRHFLETVAPRIVDTRLLAEGAGPAGLIQEYAIHLTLDGATTPSWHRIIAVLVYGEACLSGERMFSDDAFFRTMLGPLWDELEPLDLS